MNEPGLEVCADCLNACKWKPAMIGEDDVWSTSCGTDFVFFEDGPEENIFNYCPKCGKKIKITR